MYKIASRESREAKSEQFSMAKEPWTNLDDAQSKSRWSELGRRCARSLSKQQTGQQRRRRQAPANHTCRALNANHTLFALSWTSLLRAQTPASVFTPNQRTTPLSLMMISVASCYPPGLGPQCSLPINGQRHLGGRWFRSPRAISPRKRHSAHPCSWMDGWMVNDSLARGQTDFGILGQYHPYSWMDACLDDSRASRQTDLGVLAQSRDNVIHICWWFRTASIATSYFTASHRTMASKCPWMTLLRGPITLWFSMSVQRTMPC
jgi:hypothetical protein